MLAVQAVTVALETEVYNNAMISRTTLSLSWYFWHILKIVKSNYQVSHVCPSVRMEQLVSHWTDFMKFDI
jgi:sulfur relay (sulfurtransferase) DsrC/TusE family protein